MEDNTATGERLLRNAIRTDPKLADAYFELGRLLEKKDSCKGAVVAYTHAVDLDPKEAKYHYRLLFAYRKIGERQKAQDELRTFQHGGERNAGSTSVCTVNWLARS